MFTTHIDDIFGRGEPDILAKMRFYSERRFWESKLRESSLVHGGMESAQDSDFSITLRQGEFAKNLQPLPTTPQLWAARQQLSSSNEIKLRQRKLGELRWLATA